MRFEPKSQKEKTIDTVALATSAVTALGVASVSEYSWLVAIGTFGTMYSTYDYIKKTISPNHSNPSFKSYARNVAISWGVGFAAEIITTPTNPEYQQFKEPNVLDILKNS